MTHNHKPNLLLFVLLTLLAVGPIHAASFYGLSYIKLPIQDTKNSTELQFRFKTHQLNAFLFLAAGSSDYCLVYLENGQVAVKINFGSGETYLASDGLYLNDLSWHRVKLKLVTSHVSLTVNEKHNYLQRIKGSSHNLRIKYGVFLGSQDNFKGLYLGNIRSLRGCMEEVYFNQRDLLAQPSLKNGIVQHNVGPDCDEQFSTAGPNTTISFTEHDSFVVLPGPPSNLTTLTVHFEVKTISETAVLVFVASRNPYKRQYSALELIRGKLRFSANDGTGESSVQSKAEISDGQWHQVTITNAGDRLLVNVDGRLESNRTVSKRSFSGSQFGDEILLGGLSTATQSVALNYGLESVLVEQNVSVRGCVRNVHINSRFVSLFDALATNRIKTGKCKWHFLCADLDKSPCAGGAQCVQRNITQFSCICDSGNCVRPNFKHKTIVATQCKAHLKQLYVLEGSTVAIGRETLKDILPDTREENVHLKVVTLPKHGSLQNGRLSNKSPGQLDDLNVLELESNGFEYRHDGSEHYNDSITLIQVERDKATNSKHPTCQKMLVLAIQIAPSNDAPNRNRHIVKMRMAKNSKKVLNANLIKTFPKARSKKEEAVYKVIQIQNGGSSYFERNSKPQVATSEFTENELKSQSIRFVHEAHHQSATSDGPIEVNLRVHSSVPERGDREVRLLIETYEIELVQVANTGLLMALHTAAVITSANLSFGIGNETDQSQLVKYEIVAAPKYGAVQKLRSSPNQWTNATHFSQRQIDRSKVRYIHLSREIPTRDQVQLKVSFNKQVIRSVILSINFVDSLRVVASGPSHYNMSEKEVLVLLDSNKLSFHTEPVPTMATDLVVSLVSVPSCGQLFLAQPSGKQSRLYTSSSFTQRDILDGKLSYVKSSSGRCRQDPFDLKATVTGSNSTIVTTFSFNFVPTSEKYELINNRIAVIEGENVTIDKSHLFFQIENEDEIVFNLTRQPQHGSIRILAANLKQVSETNPSVIPQKYFKERRVVYAHDGSESDMENFEFAVLNSSMQTVASGKFFIDVTMTNDNMPTRVVDRPFNVIRNGERTVLSSDIKYVDADLHTSASSIIYTKSHIPNGQLLYINNSVVDKFSQADIDNGLIKLRHQGSDIAKATLWVTDGQFYLSGVLEIRASEQYIKVANNTGVWVKYGDTALISAANLSIDTNLDLANKSSVLFKITTEPKFGQILVNEKAASQFSLAELEEELVEYESTVFEDEQAEPLSKNDTFTFRIVPVSAQATNRIVDSHEFCVQIIPQSYFNLNLVIINNLTVLEEQTVALDSTTLLTEHSELKPEQIVYRITQKPKYGLILNSKLDNLAHMAKQDSQRLSFTQRDINEGLVVYQNSKWYAEQDLQSWDWFTFDVGNEVVSVQEQTIFVEIIPRLITIRTSNVTVEEGHGAVLTEEKLYIAHPYYVKLVDEFIVVEEPKFGSISLESEGTPLSAKSFTREQLAEGKMSYRQDSSEVDRDWFTVVARSNSLDKESLPATIHISINSVNDEAPRIVNNTQVYVWQNGTVLISNAYLAAVDEDTGAEHIIYTTYLPTNGYLINSDTNTTVDAFSQDDIDSGRIHFAHVGSGDASFRFHVTDGKNSGVTSVFRVKVRERRMRMLVNERLFVVPAMAQSITRRHLQVEANDNQTVNSERQFTYHVVKAPTYGRIVLEGVRDQQGERVSHFTQSQINQNLVLYEQRGPIGEPVVSDRVVFNVQSQGLPTLEGVHFLVEIAVEGLKKVLASNMHELVQIMPLVVEEGKFGIISAQVLNLSRFVVETQTRRDKLCLRLAMAPRHGLVLKSGATVLPDQCILLSALNEDSLVYMHDHSNTFVDSIQLHLMLADGLAISLLNLSLPIQITSVNDEIPIVLNRKPILKAVIGTKTVVTNQTLNTRDRDSVPASGLIYQIRRDTNMSRESHFVLQPKDGPVYEFTQEDIDQHRVFFSHRGKEMNFTYWFRVRDDQLIECEDSIARNPFEPFEQTSNGHCTGYYPLNVTIVQLSLHLLNHSAIELSQGAFQVPITRSNLATVSKSASPNFIIYRMTKGPFHGYISVEGEGSQNEFSQKQVDDQQVYYVQTNMSADDFFLVDVVQYENIFNEKPIYDVNVKIETKPLVKAFKPFLVATPAQQSVLSYEYLDASELALKTNSNPTFKILTPPRYGHFGLLNFGENPGDGVQLSEFTQEDIVRNRIVYMTQSKLDMSYPNEMLIDIIHYELSASNVQNAHGILVVNVFNNKSYHDLETLVSTDNYLHNFDLKLSKEVLFIACTITVSLVLVVCLYVLMRMNSCRKEPHTCAQLNTPKSLSHNEHINTCGRQYMSNSSLRQTDCSSRTSSSSGLACAQQATTLHHPHQQQHPMRYEGAQGSAADFELARTLNRNLLAERIDCATDLLCSMRPKAPLSDKSEDIISPLPPPSLYFINDNPLEEQSIWRNQARERPLNTRTSKERASGDGTSASSSPHMSSSNAKFNCKSQPFDQLAQLEEYLAKSDNFCTLNKSHKLKPAHSQMRNPYWI